MWSRAAHNAGKHGSDLVQQLVPGRTFPFPKSLYAVEDTLRFAVGDNPDAVVLDFFGGSGTTAHAVMRLNRQDGGRRRCILVTNNEVSHAEGRDLRAAGHRPGDPEWEALGIFEHVTRPRITAAVTGLTPAGEPVAGAYRFTDEFPMSEGFEANVEFFELTYLDQQRVELDLCLESVAPLLWARAGSVGEIIGDEARDAGFAWTPHYGVLLDTDRWRAFVDSRPATARTAFVVTSSTTTYAGIVEHLPAGVESLRLYESYLASFSSPGAP